MLLIISYISIVIGSAAYSADLIERGYGEAYVGTLMRYVQQCSWIHFLPSVSCSVRDRLIRMKRWRTLESSG